MIDENETRAVIRRLGGAKRVALQLGRSRQVVYEWIERNSFPPDLVGDVLSLCIADKLPLDHPQLRAAKRRRAVHAY